MREASLGRLFSYLQFCSGMDLTSVSAIRILSVI